MQSARVELINCLVGRPYLHVEFQKTEEGQRSRIFRMDPRCLSSPKTLSPMTIFAPIHVHPKTSNDSIDSTCYSGSTTTMYLAINVSSLRGGTQDRL